MVNGRGQDCETSRFLGHESLSALLCVYIEPFSPPDQQRDFFFPNSPDGHWQDDQHCAVPGILSDPLSQSPDNENHHWASSSTNCSPSVQQLQSSLTDGLPQREGLQLFCNGVTHHPTLLTCRGPDNSPSKSYLMQSGNQLPLDTLLPEGNSLIAPESLEFHGRETDTYSHDTGCLSESNGNSLVWSQDPNSLPSTERLQHSFPEDLPQPEGAASLYYGLHDHPRLLSSEGHDHPSLSYSTLAGDDIPHDTGLPEDNYTLDSGLLDRGTGVHSLNASCVSVPHHYNSQDQFLPYLSKQGNATGSLECSRRTTMRSGGHNETPLPMIYGELSASSSAGCASAEEILGGDPEGAFGESASEGTDDSSGTGSGCTELSPRHHPLQRMRTSSSSRDRSPKTWEFLMKLLADDRYSPSLIKWEDEQSYIFRLVKPCEIAKMWASRRGENNDIDKNNFARNLRYFYKDETLKAFKDKQYVYGCGAKAVQFYRNLLSSEQRI
ncbi:uncharacterized protein [Macrobrachium rosenbergii]|uniref:uncharacterized protein n=1 Tax=Macrobrachium rosenbergii TaxID=79674 RepID=UPI0034D56596